MKETKNITPVKKSVTKFDEKAHELKLQKNRAKQYVELADDIAKLISKHPHIAWEVVSQWCDDHNQYLIDRTRYDAELHIPADPKKKSKRTAK